MTLYRCIDWEECPEGTLILAAGIHAVNQHKLRPGETPDYAFVPVEEWESWVPISEPPPVIEGTDYSRPILMIDKNDNQMIGFYDACLEVWHLACPQGVNCHPTHWRPLIEPPIRNEGGRD